MHRNLIALAILIAAAGPAAASDEAEIMVPLHQFLDGFSKDEVKSALEACAQETSIIDDFPPYEWHGAGACARWAKDADANTAYSQTVMPLPFHGMSSYPYPTGEHYPQDQGHQDYMREYNVRPALQLVRPLRQRTTD